MTYYFSGIDNNEIANGVENYSYLNLPKKITKVGDGFLGGMFAYNKSLKTLSPYFNIPQLINDVGAQFLTGMFGGCEFLEALPDDFNLPQNIVDLDATDIEFCTQMFDETYELKLLPRNFNIPQGIWAAPRKFLEKLFFVSGIELLPAGFRFPNITRLYQDDAMRQMFYGCDNLDYLPEYFDLPQNFVADNSIVYGVFDGMFYGFDANPRYGPNFSFDQEPLTPANSFTVPIPNDYANRAYVRYAGQIFGPYNYTPTDGVAFAITRRSGSSN
jgi:hypothetical protein